MPLFFPLLLNSLNLHFLQTDLFACQKGTQEQQAAFPRRLFIYQFIRAWNMTEIRQAPDFVDCQLEFMGEYD